VRILDCMTEGVRLAVSKLANKKSESEALLDVLSRFSIRARWSKARIEKYSCIDIKCTIEYILENYVEIRLVSNLDLIFELPNYQNMTVKWLEVTFCNLELNWQMLLILTVKFVTRMKKSDIEFVLRGYINEQVNLRVLYAWHVIDLL